MPRATTTVSVNGGKIRRNPKSGEFVSVSRYSDGVTSSASKLTRDTAKEASAKRSAALKRLADR